MPSLEVLAAAGPGMALALDDINQRYRTAHQSFTNQMRCTITTDYVRKGKGHDRPVLVPVFVGGGILVLLAFDLFDKGGGIDDLDAVKVL